jgi:hypothetical protein
MAQVVRSQLPRSAMRRPSVVGATGLAEVLLTPVGALQAAGSMVPLRLRGSGSSETASVINTSTNKVINTSTNKRVKTVGLGSGRFGSATRGAITTDLS